MTKKEKNKKDRITVYKQVKIDLLKINHSVEIEKLKDASADIEVQKREFYDVYYAYSPFYIRRLTMPN